MLFLLVMGFCAWWIVNSANMPQSDAKSIYDIAYRAANHDLLPIAPTGSYMSLWPFQSGLVLFMEIIFRLIPSADEMTVQWIYLPLMALSLISAYMVVRRMFSTVRTRVIWCIFMSICFPYYFHINNMYGEIPSIAMAFFTLWMLLDYLKCQKKVCLGLASLGLAAAVAVKTNMVIFAIAIILVLLVLFLTKPQKQYIMIAAFLIVSVAAGEILPRSCYEIRAKNTMGEGVPAISFIAMGLQWSEGREPGGWNGYHSDLYINCGYDAEVAAQISGESVKDSVRYMIKNPSYTALFFYKKTVAQWAREDCMCLYETLDFYGERTESAWDIYTGGAKDKFMGIMEVYQSLVYVGAACFCFFGIAHWKKRKKGEKGGETCPAQNMILLVTFIGGFLFSLIWEAGARYALPYFVMLLPYAADGLAELSLCITKRFSIRPGTGIMSEKTI